MSHIVVRPLDPSIEGEESYVIATSTDAVVNTHGGRCANREMFRDIILGILDRSIIEIATFDDDTEVIWGFAVWSPDHVLELFYLRQRLLERNEQGFSVPKELANEVTRALLGGDRFVRMRRLPLQRWVWSLIHMNSYQPTVFPEGV